MHFHKYQTKEEVAVNLSFFFLLLLPSSSAILTARRECSSYYYHWSSTKPEEIERETERDTETEREKRSEYYGSSENICQFWIYTRCGSANQRKNFGITSKIKRENRDKREGIRAISCRRSFFFSDDE
jgi:hypothetical protein